MKKDKQATYAQLIFKYCRGKLNDLEKEKLAQWQERSKKNKADFQRHIDENRELCSWIQNMKDGNELSAKEWKEFIRRNNKLIPLKRPKIIYTGYKMVACISIIIGFLVLYFLLFKIEKSPGTNKYAFTKMYRPHFNDPENRIMLRLADGTYVSTDTIGNNRLPDQGDCHVMLSDSTITYVKFQNGTRRQQQLFFNCISTSYGKRLKVKLPDGSSVLLNAASSIRFPVSYCSKERTVEFAGEALFRVKSIYSYKTKIPFIVHLKSPTGLKQKVIVTGTTFNINAYGDEPVIKTTLLEGRVIVKGEGKNIALQPGEELQMGKSKIILQLVPIEEAISWNSDSFSFVNKPAGNVLKEIARWYGLSITLEGDTSSGITLNAPRSMDPSVLVRAVFYHIKPLNGKKNIIVRPAIQKLAL